MLYMCIIPLSFCFLFIRTQDCDIKPKVQDLKARTNFQQEISVIVSVYIRSRIEDEKLGLRVLGGSMWEGNDGKNKYV